MSKSLKRVLFACTQNAVRSVIAEAMFSQLACASDYQIDSCGVIEGAGDGYAMAVMMEMKIDISAHQSSSFEIFKADEFDLIISFSAEAHDYVSSWAGEGAAIEFWEIAPPHIDERSRDNTLASYRALRDQIIAKLTTKFGSLIEKT